MFYLFYLFYSTEFFVLSINSNFLSVQKVRLTRNHMLTFVKFGWINLVIFCNVKKFQEQKSVNLSQISQINLVISNTIQLTKVWNEDSLAIRDYDPKKILKNPKKIRKNLTEISFSVFSGNSEDLRFSDLFRG